MARIHRILEEQSLDELRNGSIENRRARVLSALKAAEHFAKLALEARAAGKPGVAGELRNRARQAARLAAKMIGILEIEYDVNMTEEIIRAKNVFQKIAIPAKPTETVPRPEVAT